MDIEDNVKNATALFRGYYLNGKGGEDIILSSHVLDEHGLVGESFWEIVCPELVRRGVLKSFNPASAGPDESDIDQLFRNIDHSASDYQSTCKVLLSNLKEDLPMLGPDAFSYMMTTFWEPRVREHIKEIEDTVARGKSIGKLYEFKVNGKSLSQRREERPAETKRKIIIDFKYGIHDGETGGKKYEIKGAKRLLILKYLCKNPTARLDDLVACTGQSDALLLKEIGQINELFKTKVGAGIDLIIHTGTAGYFLNRDEFDIEIKTLT